MLLLKKIIFYPVFWVISTLWARNEVDRAYPNGRPDPNDSSQGRPS